MVDGVRKPFEQQTEEEKNKFIQENTFEYDVNGQIQIDSNGNPKMKVYVCKRIDISKVTKRVMYVVFEEKK